MVSAEHSQSREIPAEESIRKPTSRESAIAHKAPPADQAPTYQLSEGRAGFLALLRYVVCRFLGWRTHGAVCHVCVPPASAYIAKCAM